MSPTTIKTAIRVANTENAGHLRITRPSSRNDELDCSEKSGARASAAVVRAADAAIPAREVPKFLWQFVCSREVPGPEEIISSLFSRQAKVFQ